MIITRPFSTQNPWFSSLEQVNRLLQEQFQAASQARGFAWRSYENEDSWRIEFDLPGVAKEQLDLSIDTESVSLKWSEKKSAKLELARVVSKPQQIDIGAISASFLDGVLRIQLPKKPIEQLSRSIEIN